MIYGFLVLYSYGHGLVTGMDNSYLCDCDLWFSGLSFRLPLVSVYFPIVFIRFRITVYPATVFVSGCPASAPVFVKMKTIKRFSVRFRPFSTLNGTAHAHPLFSHGSGTGTAPYHRSVAKFADHALLTRDFL
jgi:hypothetical protein